MTIWNKFSLPLKLLIIVLVLYFFISLILRYFIKSNKIEPNRVTRFFFEDNEKFIKRWGKQREKGRIKNYIIIFGKFCLIYAITILVIMEFDIFAIKERWSIYSGTFLGYAIGSFFRWDIDEDKYERLIGNDIANNDEIE